MIIIDYITSKSDLSGWLTAGSTVILAGITFYYAHQTKQTVMLMKKQMEEKRKEDERNEAIALNKEIAKGIFTIKNIIHDVNFENIHENMKDLEILLFSKRGYFLKEEKRLGIFAYYNILYDKSHGHEFTKEKKEEFDRIGQDLLQYYWGIYKKTSDVCIKNSIVSKEIMEKSTKILNQ